jgi:hypothetical protein
MKAFTKIIRKNTISVEDLKDNLKRRNSSTPYKK